MRKALKTEEELCSSSSVDSVDSSEVRPARSRKVKTKLAYEAYPFTLNKKFVKKLVKSGCSESSVRRCIRHLKRKEIKSKYRYQGKDCGFSHHLQINELKNPSILTYAPSYLLLIMSDCLKRHDWYNAVRLLHVVTNSVPHQECVSLIVKTLTIVMLGHPNTKFEYVNFFLTQCTEVSDPGDVAKFLKVLLTLLDSTSTSSDIVNLHIRKGCGYRLIDHPDFNIL